MRILWIPHSTHRDGTKPRAAYFIERLAARYAIHVVCWDASIRPTLTGLRSALRTGYRREGELVYHHVPRLPYWCDIRRRGVPLFTQTMFRRMVRRIVREWEIDVVLCACNWYALGLPPGDLPVPLLLDYFDILTDVHEKEYFALGDAVLCASTVLHDRARRFSVPNFYLPNGIDTRLFRGADGSAVRKSYDLESCRVVSLIGLTASTELYFVDAIELVAREHPDVRGLIVGDGPLRPAIETAVRGREQLFRLVGPVPYGRIPEFVACSDVGLYPGDMGPQFQAATPIKVLEYSAAAKPVVVPPLDELKRLNFPNLVFADPTVEGFADGIKRALTKRTAAPDLSGFEIGTLAEQLGRLLDRAGALRNAEQTVGEVDQVLG